MGKISALCTEQVCVLAIIQLMKCYQHQRVGPRRQNDPKEETFAQWLEEGLRKGRAPMVILTLEASMLPRFEIY
jgi:hypothetical protein